MSKVGRPRKQLKSDSEKAEFADELKKGARYGRFEMVETDHGQRMVWHPPEDFRKHTNSTYTPELAEIICYEVAEGKTLSDVCRQPGWPGYSTIANWRRKHPEFDDAIKMAMEIRANAMADEILHIADDSSEDWVESNDPRRPGRVLNKEAVLRSRVKIDTRKWLMGRLYPKKWGEKIEIDQKVTVDEGPVDYMRVARKLALVLKKADSEEVVDAEFKPAKPKSGVTIPNFMFLTHADDLGDDDDTE